MGLTKEQQIDKLWKEHERRNKPKPDKCLMRALKACDTRPLHRKGSWNRDLMQQNNKP